MKTILTILLIILRNISYGQIDWAVDEEFKGNVKMVKTTSFAELRSVKFSFPGQNDSVADYNIIDTRVILFNECGKPVKHLWYNSDTVGYCLWNYDMEGRVIRQTDYRKNSELERSVSYRYNGDTLLIQKYFDKNGKLYSTWVGYLDSIKRKRSFYEIIEGKKEDECITILNNFLLPWKEYSIDSTGNPHQFSERLYDEHKRLISYEVWNGDSTNYWHLIYLYNDEGKITETRELDKKGQPHKLTSQEFDKFGNVIRILTNYPETKENYIQRIDYTYDARGNWTLKKTYSEYESGRKYETAKSIREIEYFRN
jgi:hypothetical protein